MTKLVGHPGRELSYAYWAFWPISSKPNPQLEVKEWHLVHGNLMRTQRSETDIGPMTVFGSAHALDHEHHRVVFLKAAVSRHTIGERDVGGQIDPAGLADL